MATKFTTNSKQNINVAMTSNKGLVVKDSVSRDTSTTTISKAWCLVKNLWGQVGCFFWGMFLQHYDL